MGDYTVFHAIPWTGAYAIYFFVIGISAALFFFSALSYYRDEFKPIRMSAFLLSFALLLVGGVLLIEDLSQPGRFLNIMNPAYLSFKSPLAWGGLNLISFGLVSVLYFLAMRLGNERLARTLGVLGSLLAAGLPIYTGFDLTVHQNRPVWNTPLMPVLFLGLSFLSGAAVASFLAWKDQRLLGWLRQKMLWSGAVVAAMLISLMGTTAYGGTGSELTFMLMTTGTLGIVFVGLGMFAGLAAPLALLLAPFGREQTGIAIAALLLLVGGMALRYAILIGGQLVQTQYY
ncbi:MAG: polysulfide reductase NrfD [Chromatiaceae bacterium]|nr:polysulfide reductase NrfD [Chromatiaceae bacterium]